MFFIPEMLDVRILRVVMAYPIEHLPSLRQGMGHVGISIHPVDPLPHIISESIHSLFRSVVQHGLQSIAMIAGIFGTGRQTERGTVLETDVVHTVILVVPGFRIGQIVVVADDMVILFRGITAHIGGFQLAFVRKRIAQSGEQVMILAMVFREDIGLNVILLICQVMERQLVVLYLGPIVIERIDQVERDLRGGEEEAAPRLIAVGILAGITSLQLSCNEYLFSFLRMMLMADPLTCQEAGGL